MPATVEDICNLALGHLGETAIADIDDSNARAAACKLHYDTTLAAVLRSHRWNFAQARVTVALPWVAMQDIDPVTGSGSEAQVVKNAHGLTTGQRVQVKDTVEADGLWQITVGDPAEFTLDGSAVTAAVTVGSYVLAPSFGWAYQYDLPADCLRVLEVNGSEEGDNRHPWVIEGGKILTDEETCDLVYVQLVTDVTAWDSLFVEALALMLAVKLTETIRGATAKTEQLMSQYERITAPLARRIDANEGRRRKGLRPLNSLSIQARLRGSRLTDS